MCDTMWQLGVELNVTGLASNGVAAAWAGTAAHFTAFHPTNGQHVTAVIPVAADGTAVGTLTLGHTPRADGPEWYSVRKYSLRRSLCWASHCCLYATRSGCCWYALYLRLYSSRPIFSMYCLL